MLLGCGYENQDQENVFVRADLVFEGDDEDAGPGGRGAFGFLFTLATLISPARPRGLSGTDFRSEGEFTVTDFFECLTFRKGCLLLDTDYIGGRSMKTEVTGPDGTSTLTTWGRGQRALRWLDKLQGKKQVSVVSTAE